MNISVSSVLLPLSKQAHDEYHRDAVARVARYRTHAELLLAFWASMGFKPDDLMTVGVNQKRAAWFRRVVSRVT